MLQGQREPRYSTSESSTHRQATSRIARHCSTPLGDIAAEIPCTKIPCDIAQAIAGSCCASRSAVRVLPFLSELNRIPMSPSSVFICLLVFD